MLLIVFATGTAAIENVEFERMGQRGLTDYDDPRFGVAFVSTKEATTDRPGYIVGCSFHDGYATNIGVFDASRVLIHGNVITDSWEACKFNQCFLFQYITCFFQYVRMYKPFRYGK